MLRWISLAALAVPLSLPAVPGQTTPEPAAPPSLLGDAFNKLMDNQGRWAYTQRQSVGGLTASLRRETVLRVDPSRAYAEQFKPLVVEGEPPTPEKLEEFRGLGERLARRRQREERGSGEHRGGDLRLRLNFRTVTPDLAHATVIAQDARSVTYDVPLRTEGDGGGSAFDLFQVTARVNRQRREFEHATFRQRAPMRAALVANVSDAEIDCEFTPVDPNFAAVITRETERANIRILFVKRAVSFQMERSDFRRVTPYDERFGVKVGPIRTVQF
ncbi:MAG TPA: hypothetical protein VN775_05335 [Opitutaceae bacterium]|nr:hypothetical protein [Opitutaceae bacterium]